MAAERMNVERRGGSLTTAIKEYRAGRYAEAEALCAKLVVRQAGDPDLWNLFGVIARATERPADAVARYRRGLAVAPDHAVLWSNLGNVLKDMKCCETAIASHRRALQIEPDSVTSLHNLGIALTATGRDAEAIAAYDRALTLEPGHGGAIWDRAISRLRLGDYGAWADYEARFGREEMPKRDLPGKRWTGEPYRGKRLLVACEQGLGDAIWVARYLKKVKALGGAMIVECHPPAAALFAGMGLADTIVLQNDPLPEVDFHIAQCSLPSLFTPDEGAIPRPPTFTADAGQCDRLAPVLAAAGGKLKVGIVWGGSVTYKSRADRDASLGHFLRHFDMPGVQLFGLQKGPQADELASGAPVIDLSPHTADLFETAAAVAGLDLVIMTDTAVAHLAGALGKPVWVLLCRVPHWLWQHDRADTPWYPAMRLFRQRAWGDWTGPFDEAAAAMQQVVLDRSGKIRTS